MEIPQRLHRGVERAAGQLRETQRGLDQALHLRRRGHDHAPPVQFDQQAVRPIEAEKALQPMQFGHGPRNDAFRDPPVGVMQGDAADRAIARISRLAAMDVEG